MPNSMPALRLQMQRATPSFERQPTKTLKVSAALLARHSNFAVTSPSTPRLQRQSSGFPERAHHDGSALSGSQTQATLAAVARQRVSLASARSRGKNAVMPAGPNALAHLNSPTPSARGVLAGHGTHRLVVANPSFKRSANGRPPGPAGRYAVHFLPAGPGVLPSSPA